MDTKKKMNQDKCRLPVIDSYRCNNCGSCAELCPDVFQMDENLGTAVVKDSLPVPLPECVREAIAWCPTSCIEMGD